MPWTCPCGVNNGDSQYLCRSCGYALYGQGRGPQVSQDRREQVRAIRLLGIIVFIVLASGTGLALFIRSLANSPVDQTTSPSSVDNRNALSPTTVARTPNPNDAREQRLADLRNKLEGLESSFAIEREVAKKFARDAMNLSSQPIPDPDERQYLMESMDKEQQRMEQLATDIKTIQAEIAQEEQRPDINTAEPDHAMNATNSTTSEPDQATIPSNDLTETQTANCLETVGQHYAARLAIPTCQCVMAVYKKTGSAERAANATSQCATIALQALTNPGQTVTLPWDAVQ